MKIKIKNFELINMINGLNKFVGKDMPLPVRVSYAVNKNIKKLFGEYKIYDKERLKIMDGYEKKSKEEKREADERLAELLNIETEVDVHNITTDDVLSCNMLSVNDIAGLGFMTKEETAEEM
jgi:hypothetical protein